MSRRNVLPSESAAGVLALMVAANGRVDAREMRALEELDAFSRIGIRRERFVELAQGCLDDIGSSLCECSWLRAPALDYIDAMLDRVDEPRERLLLCRLAAAVITARGWSTAMCWPVGASPSPWSPRRSSTTGRTEGVTAQVSERRARLRAGGANSSVRAARVMAVTQGWVMRRSTEIAKNSSDTSGVAPSACTPYCFSMSRSSTVGPTKMPMPRRPNSFARALSSHSATMRGCSERACNQARRR